MKLWEAKAAAKKLWPTFELRFTREKSTCILKRDGEEFGRGGSWLAALRDAALRFTQCNNVGELAAKAKAQEEAKKAPPVPLDLLNDAHVEVLRANHEAEAK